MATARAALALFDGLKQGGQWLLDNLRFSDLRRNAERQLQLALSEVGAPEISAPEISAPEISVPEISALEMGAQEVEISLSWDLGAKNGSL